MTPCDEFKIDPGIREPSSISGLRSVEIKGLGDQPLESTSVSAKWLKPRLEDQTRATS
ncbi:unnamed protein product [Penicillium roqueforti FM164]|uniref:Genomic scaffold, ProqFM164S01 n=1 Tax=Penicillium roqueforti (strain FM164) TaxID=1365484 RepID=W6PWB0_PENRF|nr:unnamed protein product [Penicillium roqueforti FM164]